MIQMRNQSQEMGVAPVNFHKDIPIPFMRRINRALVPVIIKASTRVLSCVAESKTSTEDDTPTQSRGCYFL